MPSAHSKHAYQHIRFADENQIVTGDDDVDVELGNDEQPLPTIWDWAEALAVVDVGSWVRMVSGTAGASPADDHFPWFGQSEMTFLRLLWDQHPSDYRLVSFPRMPKDAYDPEEYLHAKQITLTAVSEIYLEVDPSPSFRMYLDEQVIKVTPQPPDRLHAAAWVDALFAAMQLQNTEHSLHIRREGIEAALAEGAAAAEGATGGAAAGGEGGAEGGGAAAVDLAEEEDVLQDEEALSELRIKYFAANPELINKFTFGKPFNRLDEVTVPADHTETLGGNGGNAVSRLSARIDITQIYQQSTRKQREEDNYNTCCTPN